MKMNEEQYHWIQNSINDMKNKIFDINKKVDKLIEHLMPKPKGKDQEDKTEKILKKKGQTFCGTYE